MERRSRRSLRVNRYRSGAALKCSIEEIDLRQNQHQDYDDQNPQQEDD